MKNRVYCVAIAVAILFSAPAAWSKPAKALAPYLTIDELYAQVGDLAQAHPDLIKLEMIGKSVEGRPLYVIRFNQGSSKPKPKALIAAGIHAEEVIGPAVALGAAKILAEGKNPDAQKLLDQVEVDIVPAVNPDGYMRVYNDPRKGGKIGMRKNADGVDLNRNFPLVPGAKSRHPLAGNHRPHSDYYMGPSQLSEPETRAVADLVKQGGYFVVLNLHSVAGKFLYPYDHTKKPAPDKDLFVKIGEAFNAGQKNYHYTIEQSYAWYPTLGDPDDYFYIWSGIPSFTIEIATVSSNLLDKGLSTFSEFWLLNPGKKYDYWVDNDAPALIPAIEKARELTGGKPLKVNFPGVTGQTAP